MKDIQLTFNWLSQFTSGIEKDVNEKSWGITARLHISSNSYANLGLIVLVDYIKKMSKIVDGSHSYFILIWRWIFVIWKTSYLSVCALLIIWWCLHHGSRVFFNVETDLKLREMLFMSNNAGYKIHLLRWRWTRAQMLIISNIGICWKYLPNLTKTLEKSDF